MPFYLVFVADNNNVLTIASLWAPVIAVSIIYIYSHVCFLFYVYEIQKIIYLDNI